MSKPSALIFFLGTRAVLGLIALAVTGFGVIAPVIQWLRGNWLASIVPGALVAIATVIVVLALLRLLASIEAQQPFAQAAVRSLRVTGATLLGAAVLVTVAGSLANLAVLRAAADLQGDPTAFTLELGPAMVISAAGLVCAALAQAFAHGMALADDLEGLV